MVFSALNSCDTPGNANMHCCNLKLKRSCSFPPFFCFCSVHSFPCRFEAVFHPACRQQAVPSYSRVLNGWGSNWPITDLAAYHCLPAFSGTLHSQQFFLLCLWWGEEDKYRTPWPRQTLFTGDVCISVCFGTKQRKAFTAKCHRGVSIYSEHLFLACCSEMLLETFYKLGNGRIFQKCKLFDSLALSTKSLSCLTHPVTDKQDLCVDLKWAAYIWIM